PQLFPYTTLFRSLLLNGLLLRSLLLSGLLLRSSLELLRLLGSSLLGSALLGRGLFGRRLGGALALVLLGALDLVDDGVALATLELGGDVTGLHRVVADLRRRLRRPRDAAERQVAGPVLAEEGGAVVPDDGLVHGVDVDVRHRRGSRKDGRPHRDPG